MCQLGQTSTGFYRRHLPLPLKIYTVVSCRCPTWWTVEGNWSLNLFYVPCYLFSLDFAHVMSSFSFGNNHVLVGGRPKTQVMCERNNKPTVTRQLRTRCFAILYTLSRLILATALGGEYSSHCFLHSPDEETEAQSVQVTSPKLQSFKAH